MTTSSQMPEPKEYGRLVPPFPVERCASNSCPHAELTEETRAYLFSDLETGKLIVFCGTCAAYVELHRGDRWRLVML